MLKGFFLHLNIVLKMLRFALELKYKRFFLLKGTTNLKNVPSNCFCRST